MKYGLLVISLIALFGILAAITYAAKLTPPRAADVPAGNDGLKEVPLESASEPQENTTETVKTNDGEYTITKTENGVSVEYHSDTNGSVRSRQEVNISGTGTLSSRVQSHIHTEN